MNEGMVPVSFDGCFGWLHQANGTRGAVIMNPFGFEELCARKANVMLAHGLAARGIPVLRFDWSGTGDSLGGPSDPGLFEKWRSNAQAATETLKSAAGVTEVVLIGFRFGACLAADAASRRQDVARVVMIAPPSSGKGWLRETSAFGRIMAVTTTTPGDFDGIESAGFRIARETAESIKAFKWDGLAARPAPQVDIFAGTAGANQIAAQAMQALGANVSEGVFAGYDAMMCDPTASEIPHGTLEAIAARLAASALLRAARCPEPAFTALNGYGFAETAARISAGKGSHMAGILCYPLARSERSEAVIFLNAGAIHHAGWGRMHVDMARRLARHGVASLRLDLPGIGDSASPGDPPVASLYEKKMTVEVTEAIGWLKARGYRRITLAGACSGAYQAFHAAAEDARVDSLVLLNQLCFVWSKSYSLQFAAWQATKARSMQAQAASLSPRGADSEPLNAARALAPFLPVAKKLAKGSLSALMTLQTMATKALARENPVESAFLQMSARGVNVLLAYSAGDAGLVELDRHMGRDGVNATALPGVAKAIIANADHMLTATQAREDYSDMLVAFLDRNYAADAASGGGAQQSEMRAALPS